MEIFLGKIDILTGGFPCQPFSHAGKRKGTDDSRYLWPEMLTTIRILKPSFVVGENVAGLVSMENGKTLDKILSDLANEGYTTEQFIIPACSVGAWHRRDRIWIVSYSSSNGITRQDRESIKTKETREAINDSIRGGQQSAIQHEGLDDISWNDTDSNSKYSKELFRRQWDIEPSVGRVANGIPNRVDRLKGLGNAIVPQVAFEIFKAIEQYDKNTPEAPAPVVET